MSNTGADIVTCAGMDRAMIEKMLSVPEAFVSMCKIVRENETTGFLEPTRAQIQVIRAIEDNKWVFVTKYRQAKITTITLMHLLLRDCLYRQGIEGLLIADTISTAEMAFRRLRFAYENLPEAIRAPLAKGSKGSKRELEFWHGGRVTIKTLEGRSPAVGFSIDRLHITELGEALHQQNAITNLFPGIRKRKNAKLIIESTPGKAGSYHERMWHNALSREGRFYPLFLEWWHDDTCLRPVPSDFVPSEAELEYMGAHPGMTMEHVAFMRDALKSEFVGDTRLFSSKYPSDPHDGWLGSQRPMMPEEVIRRLLDGAMPDPIEGSHGCGEFVKPIPGHTYELYADPTGFGQNGDPAALTVFDMDTLEEVAVWSGVEAPDRFAVRISLVCEYYNNARAVVESNHAGCITALRSLSTRLYYSKRRPGWWASSQSIAKAEFALVQLLREESLVIRSRQGLQQLLRYDGDFSRRVKGEDDVGHHFDRARTYVMAGALLQAALKRLERRRKKEAEKKDDFEVTEEGIPYGLFDKGRDTMGRKRLESATTIPRMR